MRVLVLPWAVFGAVVGAYSVWFGLGLGKTWEPGWQFYLKLWVGLGLAADLLFGLIAWWQLRYRFRELALRRFNPAPSTLARWFGPAQAGGAGVQPAGTAARDCRLDEPPRRDERREDAVSGTSAVFAPRRFELTAKSWRIRLALACCLVLVAIGLGFIVLRPRAHLTPAVVVSLNQSNGPVRGVPRLWQRALGSPRWFTLALGQCRSGGALCSESPRAGGDQSGLG